MPTKVKDYTDTNINEFLVAETSVLNSYDQTDALDFDQLFEGVPSQNIQFGGLQIGKTGYGDDGAGIWIGIDRDGNAKMNFGEGTDSIKWDGQALTIANLADLQDDLAELDTDLEDLQTDLSELNTDLTTARTELTELETELNTLDESLGDLATLDTVGESQLDNDAVTAIKIKDGAVIASKILAGAVTTNKLSANSVTANKITSGAITTLKLASEAVTAEKIASDTITANQIKACLLYTSPSPRDRTRSRMPSSA